jgi:hypothetical protein
MYERLLKSVILRIDCLLNYTKAFQRFAIERERMPKDGIAVLIESVFFIFSGFEPLMI